jgi:hypothetical protein
LERIRKETVIDCSKYYPGIFLKLLRKSGSRAGSFFLDGLKKVEQRSQRFAELRGEYVE